LGFFKQFPLNEVANALVALLFAASAPVAIILSAGSRGGLDEVALASWIFAAFAVNGAITVGMSLAHRQPLAFFWTIPGTVLVGAGLQTLTISEVIGAYLLTGLMLLTLGLTGWIKLAMERLPMPIVMGMVAGVFVEFGLDWIRAFETDFFLVAAMTAVFFALAAIPNAQQFMPPMIGVLVIGILVLFLQDSAVTTQPYDGPVLAAPRLFLPEFSLAATLELVLPLTITVIATQNAQGIIILRSAGHSPPVNSLTAMCGAGSLVAALFGCVSTCLTGPSNALLVSSGAKERQWIGGVILGVIAILFGAFAPAVTNLLIATPTAFLSTLAGLALLRTLQSAFQISFGEGFTSGALVAFLVTFAGLPILNIGSPFWGLVFGVITSLLIERQSFLKL
jgi:benzoate membrane transport protein